MNISYAGLSDVGKKRERNEDAFTIVPDKNFLILCDGMGGLDAGDVASQTAVNTISQIVNSISDKYFLPIYSDLQSTFSQEIKNLVSAIRITNKRIFNLSKSTEFVEGQMGTTVELVCFAGNNIFIGHVGDSRVYRLRDFELEQLTDDHSWVNELLQDKEITEAEAENFPGRNVITRALGVKPLVKIDIIVDSLKQDDIYLLCSDGLSAPLSSYHIREIMLKNQHDLNKIGKTLINAANQNGGPDNITVALAKIESTSSENLSLPALKITITEESHQIQKMEDELLQELFGTTRKKRSSTFKNITIFLCLLLLTSVIIISKFIFFKDKKSPPTPSPISKEKKFLPSATQDVLKLEKPLKETGTVKFIFWPLDKRGAKILIDGEIRGKLVDCYDEGLHLEHGEHEIILRLDKNIIFQARVNITAEKEITIPYEGN